MTEWAVMEFHNTIKLVLYIESTSKLIEGKVGGVRQRLTCFVRTTVVSAERSRGGSPT